MTSPQEKSSRSVIFGLGGTERVEEVGRERASW